MGQLPIENELEQSVYLSRLTRAPLLSQDEEIALAIAVKRGDQRAREKLVESNMRLVFNICKSYQNGSIPFEDLVQEGAIGLMRAVERFDPYKGFRFSTYATHWIRQAVRRAMINKSKTIRLPAHVVQCLRQVERTRDQFVAEKGREPSLEELSRLLGFSAEKLHVVMQASQSLLSLDASVDGQSGTTLAGLVPDDDFEDPDTHLIEEDQLALLASMLCELTLSERLALERRISDEEVDEGPVKRGQVGRERMRQIEIAAIRKLRHLAKEREAGNGL